MSRQPLIMSLVLPVGRCCRAHGGPREACKRGCGWAGRSDQESGEVARLGVGNLEAWVSRLGVWGPLNLKAVDPDVEGVGPTVLGEGGEGH